MCPKISENIIPTSTISIILNDELLGLVQNFKIIETYHNDGKSELKIHIERIKTDEVYFVNANSLDIRVVEVFRNSNAKITNIYHNCILKSKETVYDVDYGITYEIFVLTCNSSTEFCI